MEHCWRSSSRNVNQHFRPNFRRFNCARITRNNQKTRTYVTFLHFINIKEQNITWSQLNPFRSFAMLRERPLAMLLSVVLTLDFTAQYGIFHSLLISDQVKGVIDVYVLYFKYRFDWQIMNVGIALSYAGIIIALTQGIGLRWVVPRLGERRTSLICASLLVVTILFFFFS